MVYSRRSKLSDYAVAMRDGADALYNHTANAISDINLKRRSPGSVPT